MISISFQSDNTQSGKTNNCSCMLHSITTYSSESQHQVYYLETSPDLLLGATRGLVADCSRHLRIALIVGRAYRSTRDRVENIKFHWRRSSRLIHNNRRRTYKNKNIEPSARLHSLSEKKRKEKKRNKTHRSSLMSRSNDSCYCSDTIRLNITKHTHIHRS